MAENIIYNKSIDFSLLVIEIYKTLVNEKEFVLSKQLLRSATSIGANVAEAKYAQSTKDFISKMSIALKEANETYYWIELLSLALYIDEATNKKLKYSCNELRKILVNIVRSSKNNLIKE